MTLERFRELVAAYGGDLGRWPDHERARGRELYAASAEARAVAAEEAAFDDALAELPEPPLPPALAERLASVPAVRRQRRFSAQALAAGLVWAAAAALGLYLGAQSTAFDSNDDTTAETAAAVAEEEVAGSGEAWTIEDESIALALGSFAEIEETP